MALLLKTNHQILIALFLSFEIICIISSLKLTDIEEPVDCKTLYDVANETTTKLGPNWQDKINEMYKNATDKITQCRKDLNTTEYPQAVADYLDFEINSLTCSVARSNTWTVVGIIFIIAFLISTAGLAVISVLYYKNLRRNI
ncbi:hypothetical protein ACQ4LE_000398 [Meloidogyne hapla]|uniref:Uncharacterized protein n=1 Tax=Meloidogyne hapla TaxID=6305 RepID=A0A1I8BDM6_MELHA